jgi:hypothetical protein
MKDRMTLVDSKPVELAPSIRSALNSLRRGIHLYVWADGLILAAGWLILAFWIDLGLDWFFEFSLFTRTVILAATVLMLAIILVQRVLRRVLVRLTDANMALLLERRCPQLQESLLTSVELTQRTEEMSVWHEQMLAHTRRLAAQAVVDLPTAPVFDLAPLRNRFLLILLLLAASAVQCAAAPGTVGVWFRRNVLLRNEIWPRQSRLLLEGFPGKVTKVARGSDLELLVKADTHMPVVPHLVEIRYRVEGGSRSVAAMTLAGVADPQRDAYQEYTHAFRGLLYPLEFDVVGGDSALRGYRIEVVESPTFVQGTVLEVEYPKYTGRPVQKIPFSGAVQLPFGSQVTIAARSNKDLLRVKVDSLVEDKPGPSQSISIAEEAPDRRAFRYPLHLIKDTILLFTLFDADGIHNREPVRLVLSAVPDEPPRLALQLRGIGAAITAKAHLPVAGTITDDYGVARVWCELGVDQKTPVAQTLLTPAKRPTDLTLDATMEVEPLAVKPGQKLLACVKGADAYDLAPAPNVGTSERWQLDVVTPQQLQTMLEARELVLRQRFEAIIQEVSETREMLARIDFKRLQLDAGGKHTGSDGAEPGEAPAAAETSNSERILNRIESALQQGRKSAYETASVAESFDDIRLQLVNNRIDTEELIHRLKDGISDPLTEIAQRQFPELEHRLDRLRENLAQPPQADELGHQALEQFDRILLAMDQVLHRMHELENFNEVVEKLREIIQEQVKLEEQTKLRHKQKLRDLLQE